MLCRYKCKILLFSSRFCVLMDSYAGEVENVLVSSFVLILWVFCVNKNLSIFLFLFILCINIIRKIGNEKKNIEFYSFKVEINYFKVKSLVRWYID